MAVIRYEIPAGSFGTCDPPLHIAYVSASGSATDIAEEDMPDSIGHLIEYLAKEWPGVFAEKYQEINSALLGLVGRRLQEAGVPVAAVVPDTVEEELEVIVAEEIQEEVYRLEGAQYDAERKFMLALAQRYRGDSLDSGLGQTARDLIRRHAAVETFAENHPELRHHCD